MDISKKIYLLRTESNLTQSEFGKIAGATDKAVSAWENGIRSPKLRYIKPICDYFGLELNVFSDESNDIYAPSQPQAPDRLPPLPPKLQQIAAAMDELNEEGQDKIVEYASDLVASGRYIKSDSPELGQKQA